MSSVFPLCIFFCRTEVIFSFFCGRVASSSPLKHVARKKRQIIYHKCVKHVRNSWQDFIEFNRCWRNLFKFVAKRLSKSYENFESGAVQKYVNLVNIGKTVKIRSRERALQSLLHNSLLELRVDSLIRAQTFARTVTKPAWTGLYSKTISPAFSGGGTGAATPGRGSSAGGIISAEAEVQPGARDPVPEVPWQVVRFWKLPCCLQNKKCFLIR